MIRTVLAFTAAASLAAAAVPALAQTLSTQPAPASWKPLPQRQDQVAAQIADGADKGTLSELQQRDLRDQFKGLLDLEDQYKKTGLTQAQTADLEARYDTLEARIQVESHPASVDVRRAPTAASAE
ncbi:MAG TPA: hypothetical protein VGM25_12990 [Caulobacteraceae bacterium]|jgi:hypothetical protein